MYYLYNANLLLLHGINMPELQIHKVNGLNKHGLQIVTDILMYTQKLDRKFIKVDDYVLVLVKEVGFPISGYALMRKTIHQQALKYRLIHLIANNKKNVRLLKDAVNQISQQNKWTFPPTPVPLLSRI